MKLVVLKLLLNALAVFLISYALKGVYIDTYITAIIVALVLAVLNVFVKPVLIILTLPITVFTLGLFLLVINALIILLVDNLIEGFSVTSIWWAMLFSILMSLLQPLLNSILKDTEK